MLCRHNLGIHPVFDLLPAPTFATTGTGSIPYPICIHPLVRPLQLRINATPTSTGSLSRPGRPASRGIKILRRLSIVDQHFLLCVSQHHLVMSPPPLPFYAPRLFHYLPIFLPLSLGHTHARDSAKATDPASATHVSPYSIASMVKPRVSSCVLDYHRHLPIPQSHSPSFSFVVI